MIRIRNRTDVDQVVRDCYGREHVLFPTKEIELPVLAKKGTADGSNRSD